MSDEKKFESEVSESPQELLDKPVSFSTTREMMDYLGGLPPKQRAHVLFNKINELFVCMNQEDLDFSSLTPGVQIALLRLFLTATTFSKEIGYAAHHYYDEDCRCGVAAAKQWGSREAVDRAVGVLDDILERSHYVNDETGTNRPLLMSPSIQRPEEQSLERLVKRKMDSISGPPLSVQDETIKDRAAEIRGLVADVLAKKLGKKLDRGEGRDDPGRDDPDPDLTTFSEETDEDGEIHILMNGERIKA
jgi:hypothetical protein